MKLLLIDASCDASVPFWESWRSIVDLRKFLLRVRRVQASGQERMISVRGAHYRVTIVRESKSIWMVRGDCRGEMIEVRASSELSALSRWQAQAQASVKAGS